MSAIIKYNLHQKNVSKNKHKKFKTKIIYVIGGKHTESHMGQIMFGFSFAF